jgi:chemotaxis protein MotB
MRRRKAASHGNHERWLVSYADFITLLFAFFVVLYASAQVDKHKAGKLAEAIEEGFQDLGAFRGSSKRLPEPKVAAPDVLPKLKPNSITPNRTEVDRLTKELEQSLAPEIARNEISIHLGPDGLVLSLREIGFFDSGSAQMRPDALETFGRIANVLSERPYRLRVEGHTDNLPIHNGKFASNWELSTARATEVVRLLAIYKGIVPENLAAAGYAEFHPAGDNATEEGRQANRRVDVVVLTGALHEGTVQ